MPGPFAKKKIKEDGQHQYQPAPQQQHTGQQTNQHVVQHCLYSVQPVILSQQHKGTQVCVDLTVDCCKPPTPKPVKLRRMPNVNVGYAWFNALNDELGICP
jgi:hypothetical protein|tara:strand:+ start:56 stop:358 length:303 start_codon:yes stop_codon:yes gene_type:complete